MHTIYRIFLAAIAASFATHCLAQNVPTGPNCEGAGMLACAPFVAAALAKKALVSGSTENRLAAALETGDAEKAKKLLKKKLRGSPEEEKAYYLDAAMEAYLKDVAPARQAARREIVQYLLENTDQRGAHGTAFLQKLISADFFTHEAPEQYAQRRLILAGLAFEQGASARHVDLGRCKYCEVDDGLLPMLVRHGADPQSASPLLAYFIEREHDDAARRLIELGADPNGEIAEWRGPLHRLAERCPRKEMRENLAPKEFERVWQDCVASGIAFATFAVRHGADPNGKSSRASLCDTPYSLALQAGNQALAETLRTLGADPGFTQRCKRTGP